MPKQEASNRVYVRADSSSQIGSGHIFRCLALAAELRNLGATVEFICGDLPGNISAQIKQQNFLVHFVPGYKEGGLLPWQDDADRTLQIIGDKNKFHLVVDHYQLDSRWESCFYGRAEKLLVIDDLADRRHECDLLLDTAALASPKERYESLAHPLPIFLFGPRFALLKSLYAVGRKERDYSAVKNILLFFGAADQTRSALLVMDALATNTPNAAEVHLVLGMSDPHREQIRFRAKQIPRWHCYDFVKEMQPMLSQADLYIGSGGAISWERCSMALPSIVIAVAKNQEPSSKALGDLGIIRYLGPAQGLSSEKIQAAIHDLCANSSLRREMGEKSVRLVDGRGSLRVARALLVGKVSLRKVKPDDCEILYTWRNSLEIRAQSLNSAPINFYDHQKWYEATLKNPHRALFLAYSEGEAVGVLRLDKKDFSASVSIYLNPNKKGMGYGPEILRAGNVWAKDNWPEVQRLDAEILPSNKASLAAFSAAGYVKRDTLYSVDLQDRNYDN